MKAQKIRVLMNGTGCHQVIGNCVLTLMQTEPHWYEARLNGSIIAQTRGKKEAVAQFKRFCESMLN